MKKYIVVFIIAIAYSCSPKIVPVTESIENEVKTAIVLNPNQYQGKVLFEANCAKCHDLHKPSDYKPEKWTLILKKMIPNTELDEAQTALVYDYLTSGI